MTHTMYQKIILFTLVSMGLSLGLVNCSGVPPKPTASSGPSSTGALDAHQQHAVEQQLLQTISKARKLGPGNPLLLSTMYSLASFYREQKAFDKAERTYREALELKEQIGGPTHRDLPTILYQYAALLRDAHREQDADKLEQRARQIQALHSQAPAPQR